MESNNEKVTIVIDKTFVDKYKSFNENVEKFSTNLDNMVHNETEKFLQQYSDEELSAYYSVQDKLSEKNMAIFKIITCIIMHIACLIVIPPTMLGVTVNIILNILILILMYDEAITLILNYQVRKMLKED